MARNARRLAAVLLLSLAMSSTPILPAQSCVGFSSIVAGSTAIYATYQIKFTWVGEQMKIKRTFGIGGTSTVFSTASFLPCILPPTRYDNDQEGAETITMSGDEIKRFIDQLALRPELQTAASVPAAVLSWQILRPAGPNTQVFEHVSNVNGAKTVMLLLLNSLDPGRTAEKDKIIAMKRIYVGIP